MKSRIICIIEDTGERRRPVEGESWMLLGQLERFQKGDVTANLCGSVFAHDPSDPDTEVAIVREVTLFGGLSADERAELASLREFHQKVTAEVKSWRLDPLLPVNLPEPLPVPYAVGSRRDDGHGFDPFATEEEPA